MSYLFNNNSAVITFPDRAALDATSDYTLSFWVKLSAVSSSMAPVSKLGNYLAFFAGTDADKVVNGWTTPGSSGAYRSSTDSAVATTLVTTWHHVVMVVSSDAPGAIYIDGVDAMTSASGLWYADTRVLTNELCLGNQADLSTPLKGRLAEPAIWNSTVLSGGNVTALYGGASPMALGTPPSWYARLKTDAVDLVSGDTGTVSLATQDADHPTVDDPPVGGGGTRNRVMIVL